MDTSAVSHGIQLAVAPVFMLSAVAALIGALATRLARIIDRARNIEERLADGNVRDEDAAYWELDRLRLRGRVVNWSVGLLVVCAMLIGATVVTLFLGETLAPRSENVVPWSFLGGIVCFVLALMCFLAETLLASHTLRFAKPPPGK
jgi:NADH:ubiquinone oxidoreductase subunit 3 (subunit A)